MKPYPPGTRIGQYEIASRPLMGGMGIVYICLDRVEDRPVALKTLRPEFLPDRAARDRFLREGTHWVGLGAHPHVVRCYRVLRIDPEIFLVLELIAKEQGRNDASLRSWLTPSVPLAVEQALLFAIQIARGMAHAAGRIPGFVHRDLKPENILVGADHLSNAVTNRLRVTDFGLAAVLESTSERVSEEAMSDIQLHPDPSRRDAIRSTQLTHGIVGTPLYMAPEQWQGKEVTVRTDMYALGCTLYEMLVGQRAVAGRSLAALKQAHCVGDLRPLPREIPEIVKKVVTRCLAQEPRARYGSWEEIAEVLGAVYAEVTGQAVPTPEPVQALDRAERVATGWSYNAMGASYLDISKSEVAVDYFEQAWSVGQREEEHQLEAAGLGNLGLAYADLGDMWQAITYYKQAVAIDHQIDDRQGEGKMLGNLGNAYAYLGDVRRAVRYHEQALLISREVGDRRGEGAALGNLGNACRELGDIQQSIEHFEQALSVVRHIGNRSTEGILLGNLGSAYLQLGDARRAVGYYEQALAIAREIGDRRAEGAALGNLGSALMSIREVQQAIGFLEQSLTIAREVGDRRGEGTALGNIGAAYIDLGNVQRATECYKQSLTIRQEINDVAGIAMDSFNMALLYQQQNEPERALSLAQQAVEIWDQIGSPYTQQAQQLVTEIRATLR